MQSLSRTCASTTPANGERGPFRKPDWGIFVPQFESYVFD